MTSPEAVIGLPASPITSIVTYEGTTMILDQDHVAYVWGAGTDDQIGNGASSNVATPTELSVLSGSTDELVAAIGEGQGFGIVATTSGDVYTWGSDAQGQLGNLNGPWNNSLGNPSVATPTQIPLPSGSGKAIAVAGGSYNGAALTDTGKIVTWGDAFYGDLGAGDASTEPWYSSTWYSSPPILALDPSDGGTYTSFAFDSDSITAIDSKGALSSWGLNDNGQLGTGSSSSSPVYSPTSTLLPAGVVPLAVSGGGSSVYVLTDAGPPSITSANGATFTVGQSPSFEVTTAGVPTPSITETGALPTGVSLTDNGDGTASFIGTPTESGVFPLTISSDNGFGTAATQAFTLTVDGPPSFTSPPTAIFGSGATGNFQVTTSGYPAATIALLGDAKPPKGLTLGTSAGGAATISGVTTVPPGTYKVRLQATNTIGTAHQSLSITVVQPPAFTSATSVRFTQGRHGSFAITATGSPSIAISTTSTLPSGLTLVPGASGQAVLSGTPAKGSGRRYVITLVAANPIRTTQRLVVQVRERPRLDLTPSLLFYIGRVGTNDVHFSSGYPGAVKITLDSVLPKGISFHSLTGGTAQLTGTVGGPARTTSVTLTATNAMGGTTVTIPIAIEVYSGGS